MNYALVSHLGLPVTMLPGAAALCTELVPGDRTQASDWDNPAISI